jgi:hypothetical protein
VILVRSSPRERIKYQDCISKQLAIREVCTKVSCADLWQKHIMYDSG